MTDLKRLQDAMLRQDLQGIARELFQWRQCGTCEVWANVMLCKAPGCTAVLCPECMAIHGSYHLEEDPKNERPM